MRSVISTVRQFFRNANDFISKASSGSRMVEGDYISVLVFLDVSTV